MNRATVAAVAVAIAQTCTPIHPAIAAPCTAAAGVVTGGAVPCDGILWPAPMTVDALRCRRVDLPRCTTDAEHAAAVASATLAAAVAEIEAWRTLAADRAAMIDTLTAPAPPVPWYRRPAFVFAGGVVVGGVAVAGAVYGAGRLVSP
jgi:hypothetical protein